MRRNHGPTTLLCSLGRGHREHGETSLGEDKSRSQGRCHSGWAKRLSAAPHDMLGDLVYRGVMETVFVVLDEGEVTVT